MSRQDRSRMSIRELIAEAERREIAGAEWMDRAALVRALEEGDASSEGALGALARARRFFGHVTGLGRVAKVVRGAIDPARPSAPTLVRERAEPERTEEVPAAPVLRTTEATEAPEAGAGAITDHAGPAAPELVARIASAAPAAPVATSVREEAIATPAASELLAGDPSFGGVRVVSRNGRAWLVWRAPGARLAALSGRATPPDELTLRMVSVGCAIGEPNAEVVVETADESGLGLEGVRALPETRGRQCVAAIGVGRGERFVAVAHARVA